MAFSFLSYMVGRKFLLSHFSPLFLLQHLSHHTHYTLLFLLFCFVLPFLSTPLLPCNLHTIYIAIAFYSGTLVPSSFEFWCPCNCTHNILWRSPPLSVLFTPLYSFWLLLGVILLYRSAILLSSKPPLEVPFLLFFFPFPQTFPLFMSHFSTPKTLYHFFNFLLPPHFSYSTLYYSAP